MPLREKLVLFVIALLLITTVVLTSVWYNGSNSIVNSYVEGTAASLMKDAYNAFSYLLTDAEYLSSLVIMNKENIITPLQIINSESKTENNQLTYRQLINKRIIDSYIGSMYGHKYFITGISVVSTSGHLFKIGEALYYPYDITRKLKEYGIPETEKRMVLLPPVDYGPMYTGSPNRYVVPAVRNILNFEGHSVGFVILYFDYAIIKDIFSNNLPPNSIFEVHDRFGNTIFSNIDTKVNILNNGKKSYIQSQYYAENAGWYFTMAIPVSEIRGSIHATMYRALLIMAVLALAAIGLGVLSVYRLTENLEKLNHAMLEVAGGNLNSRSGLEGNDEMGKMGKIFDNMVSEIKELLGRISKEEKQKRKTEIDFLQAQINPHFISNTLNTITWMAKMHNAENIATLTKSLNSLMQSSMKRGDQFIPISDEIEYTKNYVEIQKYSAFYDFDINFVIQDEVLSFYTPRFILQPLVENAIIHGFSEEKENHRIEISVFLTGNTLQIEVFDNGKGMSPKQIEGLIVDKERAKNSYNSIGIKNIHDRIQLFFGENYGISFESKQNEYTKAILILPLFSAADLENQGEY